MCKTCMLNHTPKQRMLHNKVLDAFDYYKGFGDPIPIYSEGIYDVRHIFEFIGRTRTETCEITLELVQSKTREAMGIQLDDGKLIYFKKPGICTISKEQMIEMINRMFDESNVEVITFDDEKRNGLLIKNTAAHTRINYVLYQLRVKTSITIE